MTETHIDASSYVRKPRLSMSRMLTAMNKAKTSQSADSNVRLIGRLLSDQGSRHWRGYAFAIAMTFVMAGTTGVSAWLMRDVINRIFVAKNLESVWFIGGAIAAIYTVKGLATYAETSVLARVANAIIADVQRRIFRKMLAMSVGFYNVRHSTEFVARQAFISQAASGTLNLLINVFARDVLTLVALTFVMLRQDAVMSVMALAVTPIAVIGVRKIGGKVKKVMLTEFHGFSKILESLQETVQGIRVVKAFALEPYMEDRQNSAIASFEKAANKLSTIGARSSPLTETLGGLAIAGVVIYGGLRVIEGGQEPGNFFAFITALMLAFEPAKRVARMHIDMTSSLMGVKMLYEFLDQKSDETETGDEPALVVREGEIAFNNVTFSYRSGENVLDKLSFVAEAGKTTALVGRSGGGKTTTMNMALRFYEPANGAIEIDGQPIHDVSRASLRQQIAYVSQDTFLFKGSVFENVAMGRPGASRDEIVAAAKAAHAHDFILGFERGYDSPVGEHGMQLSGGQRQRIAIARAFLKNAPIILLDEATSALDSESERAVQDALKRLCAGRTTLVIAHRLTTIVNADKICVIDKGRVVEQGSHEALMAKEGEYCQLQQFRSAISGAGQPETALTK